MRTTSIIKAAGLAMAAILTLGTGLTALADDYTISIAHNQTSETGYGIGVGKLQELLAEKAPNVTLEVFDNGTLGQERDVFEGCQLGTVDISITSIGVTSNFAPLLGVINLPFLFKDYDAVEAAFASDAMDPAWAQVESEAGLKFLGIYSQGFRHVVSNKGVIASMDDFKGLKLRVPEADLYINTFTALGTSPTPIAWGEMYTAMQTNVVDAFENTPVNVIQYNLQEVSKYETATNHIWDGAIVAMNMDKWNSLPEDVQTALVECVQESAAYQREIINNDAESAVEKVIEGGVEYAEVSDELHNEMVEAVSSVYEDYYAANPEAEAIVAAITE